MRGRGQQKTRLYGKAPQATRAAMQRALGTLTPEPPVHVRDGLGFSPEVEPHVLQTDWSFLCLGEMPVDDAFARIAAGDEFDRFAE